LRGFFKKQIFVHQTNLQLVMEFEVPQYRLALGEIISLGNDTVKIFTKYSLPNEGLTAKLSILIATITPLTDAFAIQKSSQLSKAIAEADNRRDKAINGIKGVATTYQVNHFNDSLKTQADSLLRAIAKYGDNIAALNYQLESETLRNLLEDFEVDPKLVAAIVALNLVEWVAELKAANNAFADLFMQRNEETADKKVTVSTLAARKDFTASYKELLKHLDAMQTLAPTEPQQKLIDELATLHATYDRLIQNRGNKDGA
jgi:hypothetical protein